MTVLAAVLLSLAASQAEPSTQGEPAAAPSAGPLRAAPGAAPAPVLPPPRLVPATADLRAAAGAQTLRWGVPSRCLERPTGAWRVQCDPSTKTCLGAPDAELGPDGEPRAPLDRAPPCEQPAVREGDLARQGFAIVPGLAESPPGWKRDERQRVMQVNFDLHRRLWLGGGYALGGSQPWSRQGQVAAGIRTDVPFEWMGAPALARVSVLDGWAATDGSAGEIVGLVVDASRAYPTPLLRLTTFVGKPRRYDPPLYFGLWAEVARFETLKVPDAAILAGPTRRYDRQAAAAAAVTLDLWRSRDLGSFVRLRGGAGYETANDWAGGESWVPSGGAEADLTLDGGGFHHLRALLLAEAIRPAHALDPAVVAPGLQRNRARYTAKAEYEVVVLAVNDQPLSLVLDLRAQKRDDVPGYPTGWLTQAVASARFSLWAPPRRTAPEQDRL